MHLATGLRPNQVRELTALPQTPYSISGGLLLREGGGREGDGGEREGEGRGGDGRDNLPPHSATPGFATGGCC